jgi:hypothetical protein
MPATLATVASISTGKAVLIGLGTGVAVLVVGAAAISALRRPRRAPGPDIPPGMQPGPADADLEKPILEKLYAWGAVLILFMAIWVPVVWLKEPSVNESDQGTINAESVARGHLTTLLNSEQNPLGFGCVRCHGPGLSGGHNVFNLNVVPVPNLQTVCGGEAFGHPLIKGLSDVIDTIAMGRDGTDMPSWSVRFKGAMDDQQINDLVNYILSIQKVPPAKNICLNPPKA